MERQGQIGGAAAVLLGLLASGDTGHFKEVAFWPPPLLYSVYKNNFLNATINVTISV